MTFDYDLKEEKELFMDGIRAGIKITLSCLGQKLPEFIDNLQVTIDTLLDAVDSGKVS